MVDSNVRPIRENQVNCLWEHATTPADIVAAIRIRTSPRMRMTKFREVNNVGISHRGRKSINRHRKLSFYLETCFISFSRCYCVLQRLYADENAERDLRAILTRKYRALISNLFIFKFIFK